MVKKDPFYKTICAGKIITLVFLIWLGTCIFTSAESSENTTFHTAKSISVNTDYTDNLVSSLDANYYKFTHDYVDKTGNYWSLFLYDGDENLIISYSYEGRSSDTDTSAKIGLPQGTYYAMVKKSTYLSNANYVLRVNYVDDPNWETESNETFYTADHIFVNTTMHGSIHRATDIDRYQFVLPESGYISLTFVHAYVDKTGNFWDSVIYDTNEKMIAGYTYTGRSADVSNSAQIGLPAGTYYLEIRASTYRSSIPYDFQINYNSSLDWEKEFNETAYTSTSIPVNTPIYGSICRGNDIDYFKVQISESAYYAISFTHQYIDKSSSWWNVGLQDSGGGNIKTFRFDGAAVSDTSSLIYLSSGTYYIVVSNGKTVQGITYSLKIDKHIHNYNSVYSVTPASLSENGKIIMKCSCGTTGNEIIIYHPQTIQLSDTQFSYDGRKKNPSVVVVGADGRIIDSSNYTVMYDKESKNVGKYNVKIIFIARKFALS